MIKNPTLTPATPASIQALGEKTVSTLTSHLIGPRIEATGIHPTYLNLLNPLLESHLVTHLEKIARRVSNRIAAAQLKTRLQNLNCRAEMITNDWYPLLYDPHFRHPTHNPLTTPGQQHITTTYHKLGITHNFAPIFASNRCFQRIPHMHPRANLNLTGVYHEHLEHDYTAYLTSLASLSR